MLARDRNSVSSMACSAKSLVFFIIISPKYSLLLLMHPSMAGMRPGGRIPRVASGDGSTPLRWGTGCTATGGGGLEAPPPAFFTGIRQEPLPTPGLFTLNLAAGRSKTARCAGSRCVPRMETCVPHPRRPSTKSHNPYPPPPPPLPCIKGPPRRTSRSLTLHACACCPLARFGTTPAAAAAPAAVITCRA